jgi:glycosyltransferase involved in cell wall biosynthesis
MSVYNGQRFVAETIESVLDQTYKDFEFIIVNDGSTDGTGQIIKRYKDRRIQVINSPANLGLPAALNLGVRSSNGAYIARVDADDPCFPDRFEKQVRFLDAHSDIQAVGGAAVVVNEAGRRLCLIKHPSAPEVIRKTLPKNSCFVHGAVMMRRSAFEQVDGYREQFTYAQDYDLWLRMSERGALANLDDEVVRRTFRVNSPSLGKWYIQEMFADVARELAMQRCVRGEDDLQRNGQCAAIEAARDAVARPVNRKQFSNSCLHWAEFFYYQGCRLELLRLTSIALIRCPANGAAYRFIAELAGRKMRSLFVREREV